jgi:hypothetical protein
MGHAGNTSDVIAIVECSREVCGVQAFAGGPDGPWDLTPQWQHLLKDER